MRKAEESQIWINQERERTVFSLLIGRSLRPFPDNTVLPYSIILKIISLFHTCVEESAILLSMLGEKPGASALAPLNVFVDLVVPENFYITFDPENIICMFVSN